MKKYYTVEDLANGDVILKFKKDEKRVFNIVKEAFREDEWVSNLKVLRNLEKGDLFYREDDLSIWWGETNHLGNNIPLVSEKYILLPGESIPEKGFTWDSLLDEYYDSKDHGPFSEYLKRNFKCNVKRL